MTNGRPKNPTIAGVLSGVMPGLGQFYCRQWAKGTAFLVAMLGADAGTGMTSTAINVLQSGQFPPDPMIFVVGAFLVLVIAAWSVVDAVRAAKKSSP